MMSFRRRRSLTLGAPALLTVLQCLFGQGPQMVSGEEFLRSISALPLPTPALASTRELELPQEIKIDPQLRRLLAGVSAEDRGRSPRRDRTLLPARIQTAMLAQVIAVEAAIRLNGGEITADFENTIWALMPSDAVTALASLPAVASVSAQPVEEVMQEPVGHDPRTMAPPGDGVQAAHLDLLHRRGLTGKGVRVGILDRGFGGYSRLQGIGKVKAAQARRAFPAWHGVENQERHGSACAEILSSASPGAELYLASFDGTQGRLVEAANWLLSLGVNIINYSGGNVVGSNDGTDEVSRFLDFTSRHYGVLWVVAAGNHATQHWSGEFGPSSGVLEPDGQKGFAVTTITSRLDIVVRWSDWGPNPRTPSSTQDIDAYLYAKVGNTMQEVARSEEAQNGGASLPLERIELSGRNIAGRQFLLVLRARHLTRRVRVHVFLDPGGAGKLFPTNPAGSILNPASADSALSVGAVDVLTSRLANYSSQGPTDDGRLKPELTAPANTISWAYDGQGSRFTGTSAACSHVAAFAALLREMHPASSPFDLRSQILLAVTPHGIPHPNTLYGYGLIDGATAIPHARSTREEVTPTEQALAAVEDALVQVPTEFGDSVSSKTIAKLRELGHNVRDGLIVRVISERDLYEIGDEAQFELRASADCSCLLFVRSLGGQYHLVTAGNMNVLYLRQGEPRVFPSAREGSLRVLGPPGKDELTLVCTSHPTSLDSSITQTNASGLAVAVHSYSIAARSTVE